MNVVVGNAHDAETAGTGWFLGFSDWARHGGGILHVPKDQRVSGLCMKWFDHPAGHGSGAKPLSEGRTISLLVSDGSKFQLDFCESDDFETSQVKTVLLQRHGDYVAWSEGLYHRWHCIERSTVLTLRWTPA